jgi:hypothetical protein
LVGVNGSRKSFCCKDLPPISFFAILSPKYQQSVYHTRL